MSCPIDIEPAENVQGAEYALIIRDTPGLILTTTNHEEFDRAKCLSSEKEVKIKTF